MRTLAPDEPGAWERAAQLQLARGDTAGAIRYYEHASQLPRRLHSLALAMLCSRRGEREQAEDIFLAYESALESIIDENDGGFHGPFARALIHAVRSDTAAAARLLAEASRFAIDLGALEFWPLPDELRRMPSFQQMIDGEVAERRRQRERVLREGW